MGWDAGSLGPPVSRVDVELYTSGYRVSGHMLTRFRRVADILNLNSSSHLIVEEATVAEYAAPGAARGGKSVMVAVDAVLFGISSGADDSPNADLIVQKRPVGLQVALPPFWLSGTVHVAFGSQPVDVLSVADRFMAVTDVAVTSAAFPAFEGQAPILAIQRAVAQLLLITDDAAPDSAVADVITEEEARSWLPPEEPA